MNCPRHLDFILRPMQIYSTLAKLQYGEEAKCAWDDDEDDFLRFFAVHS